MTFVPCARSVTPRLKSLAADCARLPRALLSASKAIASGKRAA
jgi:hypothetical protein